jgi:hypothetical protein
MKAKVFKIGFIRGANGSCGKLLAAFEKGCTPDVGFIIKFSPLRKDYN